MWKTALGGVSTFIPGLRSLHQRLRRTGGNTESASYCYDVWLDHLGRSYRHGLCRTVPRVVAELGPGDSIGSGIAALLSGAQMYYGLDAIPLASLTRNLRMLDELASLFRKGTPGGRTQVPDGLIAFDESRVPLIRESINNPTSKGSLIQYIAPWWENCDLRGSGVDMLFSQAVLEHIDDLETTYTAMRTWLAPKGWISHQIDFKCHGIWSEWNAHWASPDWQWMILRGRKPTFLNREPHSTHIRLLHSNGFEIISDEMGTDTPIARKRLASRFRHLTDADLVTADAFILARP